MGGVVIVSGEINDCFVCKFGFIIWWLVDR